MQHLCIVTTGGTIDKIYFDDLSTYQIGEPEIGRILTSFGVNFSFNVVALMRKDSLELTDADRAAIHAAIVASPARHILITHGTDTMAVTARTLTDIKGKVIVLTGAMQPASLRSSDSVFNVGFAFAAVQLLPDGVYVAMNGRIFDAAHVTKDRAAGRFVAE